MHSKSIPSLARRGAGRRFLASVLSLLCLAAAPAASARSGPRDDGPVYVPVPAVASHQAQLILFRGAAPDAEVGKRGLGAHVYVDGEFHGALLPNGWTRLCVAPGDHSIEAYVGDAPLYRGKARPATRVSLEGGKTYFAGVLEQGAVELRPFRRAEAEGALEGKREQRHLLSRASAVVPCEGRPASASLQ